MDEKTTTINVLIDVAEGRRWFVREDVRTAVAFMFEDYSREQDKSARLEDELGEAAAANKRLRKLLEEERDEIATLKDTCCDYQDVVESLESQVKVVKDYLQDARADRDDARERLAAAEKALDEREIDVEGYGAAFDAANEEIDRLRDENAELRRQAALGQANRAVMETNEALKERVRELEWKLSSITTVVSER